MKFLRSQTFRLIMESALLILTLLGGLFISSLTVVTTSTIALTSMITFLLVALICLTVAVFSVVVIWYIQYTAYLTADYPLPLSVSPKLLTIALILAVILCILTWLIFLRYLTWR